MSSDGPGVDLDAYFARIGYDGPRAPTLATLRAIHGRHPDAIPFENLDVLLGRPISLEPAAIDAKLIGAGRGGYCYEQNSLLKRVLTALGFQVEGLLARMLWMEPAGAPPRPRSHMVLKVTIDNEAWLADVGFGGYVLTAPIRLAADRPQPTPHGAFRLIDFDGERQLEVDLSGAWTRVYRVSPQPMADVDYEPANFFSYAHPTSRFVHSLVVGRTTPQARYALRDNRLTVRTLDGSVDQTLLDADQLETALRELIGLPVAPDWRPVIDKIAAVGR